FLGGKVNALSLRLGPLGLPSSHLRAPLANGNIDIVLEAGMTDAWRLVDPESSQFLANKSLLLVNDHLPRRSCGSLKRRTLYIVGIDVSNNSRNATATSLMSEHSTEYCLVPRMLTILKQSFQDVTPIFPAMMREFGKKSYQKQNDIFRVLTLFPRRPKVANDPSSGIYVTISRELYQFDDFMRVRGIYTIAGCPLVRTIWDLSRDPEIAWIDIQHASLSKYLNRMDCVSTSGALLTDQEILRQVSESRTFSLDGLGDIVRKCREVTGAAFMYGPKYKPVFFLIR
ncbi:hypothetical protein, partial [Pseudomonas syringae]|uniref:hypothetical protein n=1 Tax=Pseudomonas syringae TaxID=317 RepID=UPI00137267EA